MWIHHSCAELSKAQATAKPINNGQPCAIERFRPEE
jgi:hypothetical protein